jgi:tetratricopeptide (TPR) repeat protein
MQTLDVNRLFSNAEQAFLAGRLDVARDGLVAAQRLAGPHPAILHLLGLVESKRGEPDSAERAFRAALGLAPRDPQIHNNFANFRADLGDSDGALAAYRQALAAAPDFHEARYNRALLLQKLGRLEEALADLEQVATAQPASAKALSAKASVLRALGRLKEAAIFYDRALAAEPKRSTALIGRARIAMERGESDAAHRYRQALAVRPGDPELLLGLAEALEMAGDPEGLETLAAAVAAHPQWVEGQRSLARMRWEAGENRAFTADLERALAAAPANRELWAAYAAALAEADLNLEAADAAAAGRAAIGDDPQLLLLEALRASEAGQLDRADKLFALAAPDAVGRDIVEARHRLRCREHDRAIALVDRARAQMPWDVATWAMTGLCWRLVGDPRADWLLAQPGLVDAQPLAIDPAELAAIAAQLRGLHRTRAHPIGQSLRGGTQTRGNLFERDEPEIARLKQAIEAAIAAYWSRLPAADPAHPLLRHRAATPRFAGSWSVRLTDGGFHIAHFHPAGILSSACYLVVPEADEPMAGWLELGGPPWGLDVPVEPLVRIEPQPGRMALFPSYLFHGTRPFPAGERLTVAFDVVAR